MGARPVDALRRADHGCLNGAPFKVTDGFARQRNQETFELVMPIHYRFTPGSSYTDERLVPTLGAHEVPGWDFSMDARGVAR